MTNDKLYQSKHRLWLNILFASFAIEDESIKERLYDFSMMEFRHMKWLAQELRDSGTPYNYDRDMMLYKRISNFDILRFVLREIKETQALYEPSALSGRMITDENYFIQYIASLLDDNANDAEVTAFDMHRSIPDKTLDAEQTDALTIFLFEESYKEYELILVYAYMQNYTDNLKHFDIFQDLVDESHFHLKSFGNMMAKMGILALPRELHEMTYKIDDIEKFIVDGIAEEEAAKEQCRALAESIKDKELSQFFDFINYQEDYHIALMEKLLPKK
jgi:rubrerythrin